MIIVHWHTIYCYNKVLDYAISNQGKVQLMGNTKFTDIFTKLFPKKYFYNYGTAFTLQCSFLEDVDFIE